MKITTKLLFIILSVTAFGVSHGNAMNVFNYSVPGEPVHFKFSDNTGSNASIIFAPGTIVGVEQGDEIAVFNTKGDLAGATRYEGDYLAIAAWGNEGGGDQRHMAEGEAYTYRIWKSKSNREYELTVTYTSGSNFYSTNGISMVKSATYTGSTATTSTTTTPAETTETATAIGTSELSYYKFSDNTGVNATIIFPPGSLVGVEKGDEIGVFNRMGKLSGASKYDGGYMAIAAWGNETANGDVNHLTEKEKYVLKLWRAKENKEVNLSASFSSGPNYYTANGISTVQTAGYSSQQETDEVTDTEQNYMDAEGTVHSELSHFLFSDNTGNNATIIFPPGTIDGAENGDEIAVFNQRGRLAGASVYSGGFTAIAAWGNEANSTDKAHLASNEKFSLRIWKAKADKEFQLSVVYESGPDYYTVNGISTVGSATSIGSQESGVDVITDHVISIPVELESASQVCFCIYNEHGKYVTSKIFKHLESGTSEVEINIDELSSGQYKYRGIVPGGQIEGSFTKP